MRCVLIDDEPKALEILKRYVDRVPFLEFAGAFRDPVKALAFLSESPADVIFLDVNMPDLTGIQFLNTLQQRPLVVFTTAYSEYAVRSYEYDAVDYLLKPIEFERFLRAANKARDQHAQKCRAGNEAQAEIRPDPGSPESHIIVKSGTDYHRLQPDDILYLEAAGNYVLFVTPRARVMSLMSLRDAMAQLPPGRFFRVHKSYVINFAHVSRIERSIVRLADKSIPIGDAYRDAFLKAIGLP